MNNDVSDSKRTGQGRKIDERIEKIIKETMISQWMQGKRNRELSAESILNLVSEIQPDLVDNLPSSQTVRRIIKPVKERFEDIPGDLEQPWSLGATLSGADGIDDETLPLLLKINKLKALDVGGKRRRSGFKLNRLTIREARWVGKLHKCLPSYQAGDRDVLSEEAAHMLAEYARQYATRELAAFIEGNENELDTYEFDMKIAFNAVDPFSNEYRLWLLSTELGLVPPAGIPSSEVEASLSSEEADWVEEDVSSGIENEMLKLSLTNEIAHLKDKGTVLKVNFGTEDWDDGGWFKFRSYSSRVDYEITSDVLQLILPLAQLDRPVAVDDPRQVKIATAFAMKIFDEIKRVSREPEETSEEQ